MKINEAELRDLIEAELKKFAKRKNVANSKHPSDVELIEDPNVGGILVDPFEHIPEDVPADVEKPQARVQDLIPIVKEHAYSLKSVLEEMKFMGGLGFTNGSIAEGHCGCGAPDMPAQHVPSDHIIQALEANAEADIEEEEPRDLDYDKDEGSMAHSQLRRTTKYSQQLSEMIQSDDDLPEWVEAKITKASDYLGSVYHYLDYEINGKK
jgi:hypothetical protein